MEENHDKMLQYAQLIKDHCAQLSEFGYELVADAITNYAARLAKSPIDDITAANLLARLVLETRDVVEQRKRLFRYGTLLDKYAGLTEALGQAVDKELKNLKARIEQQEETIAQLKRDMTTS